MGASPTHYDTWQFYVASFRQIVAPSPPQADPNTNWSHSVPSRLYQPNNGLKSTGPGHSAEGISPQEEVQAESWMLVHIHFGMSYPD